jgi:hypothetical protein
MQTIEYKLTQRNVPLSDSDREELLAELSSLQSELRHHFEQEAAGGCLEEAAGPSPVLFHEATMLLQQHPDLLAELEGVIAHVQDADWPVVTLRDKFKNFARQMHAHEAAENRLLAKGFGMELDEIE